MLSRRSTRAIADTYQEIFTSSTYSGRHESRTANPQELYDFVYERDYEPWFCNLAGRVHGARGVLDFIMKLHTGESIASATPDWSWDKRRGEGQNLLRRLAEDMLKELTTEARSASIFAKDVEKLARPLELDGYIFKGRRLQREEADVIDVQEVHGVIESLYRELGLANEDVALHHLKNSEEHFVSGKWDDSISHSRRLLEQVLREVASAHSQRKTGSPLADKKYEKPVEVRQYLEGAGLLDKSEMEAVAKIYGLLSHTGSHPYIAEQDQGRLLRHLALTLAQFVLLRWQGMRKTIP